MNIIIISGQSTVIFDSLCSGPRSRTRFNEKQIKFFNIELSKRERLTFFNGGQFLSRVTQQFFKEFRNFQKNVFINCFLTESSRGG